MAQSSKQRSGQARIVAAWATFILLGAVALRLPVSSAREPLSFLDALFTSTSAVCVTGLSTITVGERLSSTGQVVLLVLIQIGGIGISTVSTMLFVLLGRATLSQQRDAGEGLAAIRVKPLRLLWWVAAVTISAEALGAVILANRFEGSQAWWSGVFHSVSAFCNAGFSLYSDSLTGYRSDACVVVVVSMLIAVGGLGFIALRQLARWCVAIVRRERPALFLHSRVVLFGSIVCWVAGMAVFLVFESAAGMRGLSGGTKWLAALFQSMTLRTAGFNTLDFSSMREATLFVAMFFMFVGGAPGGCAGGIKLTTAVVVLATMRAHCRGVESVTLMRRTIPPHVIQRAFQLLTLSILFLSVAIIGLLITEEHLPPPGVHVDHFTSLVFEAVSAFATVGLSTGITPTLSNVGKVIIMVTMFVGRLGPLLIALAVFKPAGKALYGFPTEEVAIG